MSLTQSDTIIPSPGQYVGGVLIQNGTISEVIGPIYAAELALVGAVPTDSTLDALVKTVNYFSAAIDNIEFGPASDTYLYAGALANNNRPVANNVPIVSLIPGSSNQQSYSALSCRNYGTVIRNIFNITNTNNIALTTNYVVKRIGSDIIMLFSGINQTTNTPVSVTNHHVLTNGSNIGSYGILGIQNDGDPYTSTIYTNLVGSVVACSFAALAYTITSYLTQSIRYNTLVSPAALIPYQFTLQEVPDNYSGVPLTTPVYSFFIDNAPSPNITTSTVTITSNSPTFISGIPRVNIGDAVNVSITLNSVTSEFYNTNGIASISGNGLVTTNYTPSSQDIAALYTPAANYIGSSAPTPSLTINVASTITNNLSMTRYTPVNINSNDYLHVTCTAFSTINQTTYTPSFSQLFLDFPPYIESNIRLRSGTGQYPSPNSQPTLFTQYDSTISLLNNEELQYIDSYFMYPPAINWSAQYQIGSTVAPDYSNISGGTFTGFRWMSMGFPINNNFARGVVYLNNFYTTSSLPLSASSFLVYVFLGSTNLWYDANTVYNPGQQASVLSCLEIPAFINSNNQYQLNITVGSPVSVSSLYVRVGMTTSATSKFSNVSFTQIA
jgi:hypothetical protein